ncbi:MAG: orotidine-5'-phosphate decarboxylase [Desulfovibrionaceae bacterium]|nr:orotidine-5'-phosphate decarboxylase [Desulfovibrionaceae bacterium]
MKEKHSDIIVALDMDLGEAKEIVHELGDLISMYKVGLELFLQSGKEILAFLHQEQKGVFLDLKLHDIPNTVKEATLNIISYPNVMLYTLHASGGANMIRASVHASRNSSVLPIAVTVLTSFTTEEWQEVFPLPNVHESAVALARYACNAGAKGVVCSAHEVAAIKQAVGTSCITVCPGIRPSGSAQQDQKRIVTPSEAIENGADYLVMGRPITEAYSPRDAVKDILKEVEQAKRHRK